MNETAIADTEIEHDRQRQIAELAADSGDDWAREFLPGTSGCHELLDRTAMFADIIEQHLSTHPACVANAEWYELAERAASALRDLYQRIGAEHLAVEK
jgi:hypothetical protein